MQKYRNIIFYISTIVVFSGIMYWFMMQGKSLDKGGLAEIAVPTGSTFDNFVCAITENFHHPLALLLLRFY